MSDIFEKIPGIGSEAKRPPCRVAYTLNNTQPVSCTIIGDQPLFYMDFEYNAEDESEFFSADISILESELRTLEEEIAAYDKFSAKGGVSTEERVAEFFSNLDSIIKPSKKENSEEELLSEITAILSQSRNIDAHLEAAKKHGVKISFSTQVEKAFYDRRAGLILINPNTDKTDMLLLCIRELRRHWQHRQGALIHPLTFQPDNAVLVNRAQIADLAVAMVRGAWELQLSGHKEAWDRLEISPMGDIARAFAREAYIDFRTINNGEACAAAFEAWFLSERCRQQDKTLIQQMLADYQGYVFDMETAAQTITPALISALGSLPFGKNYLSAHTNTIMNDPIFTDVRDRSNANFLWFIKFERSFKETEQELQTGGDPTGRDFFHGSTPQQDQRHVPQRQSAEIISLFGSQPRKASASGDGAKRVGQRSADIVYLSRLPGDI
ncbi:MAG TPA: hypothetical protein DEA55_06200 [Rhodospirillaceae bacterium]|nr:hypothetical protein [Rhodospirillaceae bacterium]